MFRGLKEQEGRLEQRIAAHRPAAVRVEPQRQVEVSNGIGLTELARSSPPDNADLNRIIGSAFTQTNVNLYLRFSEVEKGRKKFNVPAGGVVTFGSTPPPGPLYTGPTDRPIIRKMLAAGEPVTATTKIALLRWKTTPARM